MARKFYSPFNTASVMLCQNKAQTTVLCNGLVMIIEQILKKTNSVDTDGDSNTDVNI